MGMANDNWMKEIKYIFFEIFYMTVQCLHCPSSAQFFFGGGDDKFKCIFPMHARVCSQSFALEKRR